MIKLEARPEGSDIIISSSSFGHLLDCLDNQKFINDINADALATLSASEICATQNETQLAIDNFSRQCRKVWLSSNTGMEEEEEVNPI